MGRAPHPFKQGWSSRYHTLVAESDVEAVVVVNKKKRPVR